jgi:NTP pyrophosphatase (non-canonical NTP hydrolase)
MTMIGPTLETDPTHAAALTRGAAIDAAVESTGHLPGRHDATGFDTPPAPVLDSLRAARERFDARLASGTSGPGERGDLFADVADITAWLDTSNPPSPHEDSMRVLKLVEEAGEAAAAYLGMVGQNPRKGITHTLEDLLAELADVAITALCAIQHFTQDTESTRRLLEAKLGRIIARSEIPRTRP